MSKFLSRTDTISTIQISVVVTIAKSNLEEGGGYIVNRREKNLKSNVNKVSANKVFESHVHSIDTRTQ